MFLYNGTNKKYLSNASNRWSWINSTKNPINHQFKKENSNVFVIGKTSGHLNKVFFEELFSVTDGQPPEVNLINEKNNGESVLKIIKNNLANSVHDVSNGGLIIALAEMSTGSNFGIKINKPKIKKFV